MDIVMNRKTDWGVIFDLFHKNRLSVDRLLMGPDFSRSSGNVTTGNIRTLCFLIFSGPCVPFIFRFFGS